MSFDQHKNFAISAVTVAPSPATSGTSLTVADGTLFPTPPFNASVWPIYTLAISTNAEIIRVTAIVGNVLTITRAQEGSTARSILVTDQIAETITAKALTDIEAAITPMVYPGIGLAVSTGSGWGTSIADASANWNTAYTDRLKWDGGATGLVAATGRTSLGLVIGTDVQAFLVSGTNIKTINSTSLLGSGDISFPAQVYPGAGIPLSTGSAWGTSITDNSANWNTAYTDRLKWDGGATDLVAATGRTSLGLGTLATQSGTFSGTSSGTNTGDNATNSQYSGLVTMTYPGAGIANSTGSAWGTSYTTTGSGTVVALQTSPTFLTNITTPLLIGGTGTTSTLTYKTTTGVGATGADHIFLVGNNGATEAMRILNSGDVNIGAALTSGNLATATYKSLTINSTSPGRTALQIGIANTTYGYIYAGPLADFGENIFVISTAASNKALVFTMGGVGEKARLAVTTGNFLIGTTTDAASAILNVASTTKGFLPPRWTNTQMGAISSPATGLHGYNTDALMTLDYNGAGYKSSGVVAGSFSGVGTATTVFTVTFAGTQPNATYKVNVTPTAALSAALFYVTNKTTTTFDVTYLAGLTGTVTFDYAIYQ